MASQKPKRRSRKARNPGTAPRAVASTRRDRRVDRQAEAEREFRRGQRQLGREGERPEGLFGGVPVAEIAILAGTIALIVGFVEGGGAPLIVGIIVLALGVIEVTAREHFSGYRSHSTLLAAVPAVAVEAVIVAVAGPPKQRALLLVFVAPVFAVLFWFFRRRFAIARQARLSRPPSPR